MKIRCPQCRKKVSIDEAFIGAVCRCPYCKALSHVPGRRSAIGGRRPDVPVMVTGSSAAMPAASPVRPDAQWSGAAGQRAAGGEWTEHIPTARPVRVQGAVAVLLLAGLIVTAIVGTVVFFGFLGPEASVSAIPVGIPAPDDDETEFIPPDAPDSPEIGPTVAGVPIDSPIFYVVDGGGSMRTTYDSAAALVRLSIRRLKPGERFNLIICREEAPLVLGEDFCPGGPDSEQSAKMMMGRIVLASGATTLCDALAQALERKPKTIVLLSRKSVAKTVDIVAAAQQQNVRITTIVLAGDRFAADAMRRLAKATGGRTRAFTYASLERWFMRAPAVD